MHSMIYQQDLLKEALTSVWAGAVILLMITYVMTI